MTAHLIAGQRLEDLAIAAADDALGEDDARALQLHLVTCVDCAALTREHARLAQRLATPIPSETARRESLARLRVPQRHSPVLQWTHLRRLAFAAGFVLVAVASGALAVAGIEEGVGRLQIPEREVVAEESETLGGDIVVVRVEDGRFAASPGQTSGVRASADLQLTTRRAGSAELRFAEPGESYGILGGAPDLTGVTKLHIENRIPPVDTPTTFEIWLHVEGPVAFDSAHLVVTVEPSHGGVRARTP